MRIIRQMSRDRSAIRRILIRRLLSQREISSQGELVRFLDEAGHRVTQSTVSRDLADLGATKVDEGTNRERYVLADRRRLSDSGSDRLRDVLDNYLVEAIPSGNLVVLKVREATAGTVASAIDAAPPEGTVGTLAGDDTILVVAATSDGGEALAIRILGLLEK